MDTDTEPTRKPDVLECGSEENENIPKCTTRVKGSVVTRRRCSLDVEQLGYRREHSCRRSSVGSFCLTRRMECRRSSLGDDILRLNLLRRTIGSSITSLNSRRSSFESQRLESETNGYDYRRRSSIGAESLVEYDFEETEEDSCVSNEPPPEAILGLQYADDVFEVKRGLEKVYHPINCLSNQPQVTEPMRCTLVNWLVKINRELKFGPETVFLAVNLLDRFLWDSAIASDCCQLLAVVSLFVSAKMEESQVPGISGLSALCNAPYQRHHFRRMEILLLTKLGFQLHSPTTLHFINYFSLKACQLGYLDRTVIKVARRVAETCLCRYDISQFLPSIQASAALLYAMCARNTELGEHIPNLLGLDDNTVHEDDVCVFCSLKLVDNDCSDYDRSTQYEGGETGQSCESDDGNAEESFEFYTSPKLITEMITVLQMLFTTDERKAITRCSELMSNHLEPFAELIVLENSATCSVSLNANGAEGSTLKGGGLSTSATVNKEVQPESEVTVKESVAANPNQRLTYPNSRRDSGVQTLDDTLDECFLEEISKLYIEAGEKT